MREYIIDTVGEIGGHFGANFGTCELAVALHSLLDSPRDKILWDVGHQAYPHKVLTGRRDELPTIRQYGGLAPFCSREESEHDIMGAGHASTAAGYAVGIKEAMRRERESDDARVVAVVGDGAMTGGVNFEALLNAGGLETPIVIVLNDNGMSISPNVGALSRYFNRMRLDPKGHQAREAFEAGLTRLPAGIGRADRAARAAAQGVAEGVLGAGPPVRGAGPRLRRSGGRPRRAGVAAAHCARRCRRTGRSWSTSRRSRERASRRPRRAASRGWRSGTPPSRARVKDGRVTDGAPKSSKTKRRERITKPAPPQYTEVFGRALVDEARRDPRVIGITAAMAGGTGLSMLCEEIPDQYYDVGIAEQHAVLFAAGLALEGMKPVAAIYSTFLQRAYDQIVHDVCLQKLNVVFCMDRAGLVGDDGPTHHGNYDVSYLR